MNVNNKLFYPIELNALQIIKFTVYILLLINYVYYIGDDLETARHALRDNASLLDWMGVFRTSIDETAWFVLLLLFELETYALTDAALTPARLKLMHAVRCVCYLFLAHTIYANASAMFDMLEDKPLAERASVCDYVGQDVSFTFNYHYTAIDKNNCAQLNDGSQLYSMDSGAVITNEEGWRFEQYMSKLDLIESLSWIAVILSIELIVRLQDKGISSGKRIRCLNIAKIFFYGLLWVAMGHWIYFGHYVYAWDEFVWIAGFAAIEMNVAEWRQEMEKEGGSKHSPVQVV